jgi:hypothetical protein
VKSLVVVSYAINGRGLGHLTRQLAILRWVRRICGVLGIRLEAWVLTSSEGDTLARREGFCALKIPSKAMMRDAGIDPGRALGVARTWVLQTVAGLQPDLLLVDTFPGGSSGELLPVLELVRERVLVARAVKSEIAADDAYRTLLPLYQRTIVPSEVGDPILLREAHELLARADARRALGVPDGKRAVYLSLGGGGDVTAPDALPRLVDMLLANGDHVVVGAGPLYVGPERRGPDVTWLDRYVGVELFPGLDAAVAASGYNTSAELMFCGVPTVFLPQPRLADDQDARAHRAEAAGAGRVVGRLEDVPGALDALDLAAARVAARALVPRNGAREAALSALGGVVPSADLAMASELLDDALLPILDRGGVDGVQRVTRLLRVFSGGTPSQVSARHATMEELAESGHAVPRLPRKPEAPRARIGRFFERVDAIGAPQDTATQLALSVDRAFPAARGAVLVDALDALLGVFAPFNDWMGALALIRAVPVQRGLDAVTFVEKLGPWLAHEEDLFDAQRRLSHGLRDGRSLLEVLAGGGS